MAGSFDEPFLDDAIDAILRGRHGDPFSLLGPRVQTRQNRSRLVVRSCQPVARDVEVLHDRGTQPMQRRHPDGFFEGVFDNVDRVLPYRLRITYHDGRQREVDDPYRFGRILSEFDQHLFSEGTFYRAYRRLGAHLLNLDGVHGVHFVVWAPNAERVSVIGDFNDWDGRVHGMRHLVPSGLWEIFIPDLHEGERYKYEIRSRNGGALLHKTDPFGFRFEVPPRSASIVCPLGRYVWRDHEWMASRGSRNSWLESPMSIYEVHLGSWRRVPEEANRFLTYRELAAELVPYVKDMGHTHVELLPIMEHPFLGSWGYQVTGFFAPTSRYGTPDDFRFFVDECHRNAIGVILDWVPAHFPKDAFALARFDGTGLYEHEDPRQGEHQDWGTFIFNYGRTEVREFLLSNALFWLDEFHVDGLRVDAVASMLYLDYSRSPGAWVPNVFGGRENLDAIDFFKQLNLLTHREHSGSITIAEESTAWPAVSRPLYVGGLGFTFKWNMGWMHDILDYMRFDPIFRRYHHNNLTFSMLYAFSENFVLPFSHDEVVHAKGSLIEKMPGDVWQRFANLRALYGFMFGHPGKKLLFMGGEFGQWREWNHDRSLDWHLLQDEPHAGLQRLVRDLNRLLSTEAALHQVDTTPEGFRWIDCNDVENSVVSFLRFARDAADFVVFVLNFTPLPREGYRIGVPARGFYRELLNTDSSLYGGSDVGNGGGLQTEPVEAHGYPQSLRLRIPPLGCLVLKLGG